MTNLSVEQTTQNLLADTGKLEITRDAGSLAKPAEAYNLLGALISNLLTLAIFAGALAAFAFFIVGAFQWGTAGSGDGAEKGRKTMLYAAIGLVMLGLVYIVIMLYNSILPTAD